MGAGPGADAAWGCDRKLSSVEITTVVERGAKCDGCQGLSGKHAGEEGVIVLARPVGSIGS